MQFSFNLTFSEDDELIMGSFFPGSSNPRDHLPFSTTARPLLAPSNNAGGSVAPLVIFDINQQPVSDTSAIGRFGSSVGLASPLADTQIQQLVSTTAREGVRGSIGKTQSSPAIFKMSKLDRLKAFLLPKSFLSGYSSSTSSTSSKRSTTTTASSSIETEHSGCDGDSELSATPNLIIAPSIENVAVYFKRESFFYDNKYRQYATLVNIADRIKNRKIRRVLVLSGAGISTACGIPDFRSPSSGIYSKLEKYNLPYPEAIFTLQYFRENPAPFYTIVRQLFIDEFNPSLTHYFLRLLEKKKLLLRTYTQNIDSLEEKAGISPKNIVYSHGNTNSAHCIDCATAYSKNWLINTLKDNGPNDIPTCTVCNGYVKPDITLFGENLPSEFSQNLYKDVNECDLLLILGTSLSVSPFNLLPGYIKSDCCRLMINLSHPHYDSYDFTSSGSDNLFYQGECDESILNLASLIGWQDDLLKLADTPPTTQRPFYI